METLEGGVDGDMGEAWLRGLVAICYIYLYSTISIYKKEGAAWLGVCVVCVCVCVSLAVVTVVVLSHPYTLCSVIQVALPRIESVSVPIWIPPGGST